MLPLVYDQFRRPTQLQMAGEALARLTARRENSRGTSAVRMEIMGKELEALLLLGSEDPRLACHCRLLSQNPEPRTQNPESQR